MLMGLLLRLMGGLGSKQTEWNHRLRGSCGTQI